MNEEDRPDGVKRYLVIVRSIHIRRSLYHTYIYIYMLSVNNTNDALGRGRGRSSTSIKQRSRSKSKVGFIYNDDIENVGARGMRKKGGGLGGVRKSSKKKKKSGLSSRKPLGTRNINVAFDGVVGRDGSRKKLGGARKQKTKQPSCAPRIKIVVEERTRDEEEVPMIEYVPQSAFRPNDFDDPKHLFDEDECPRRIVDKLFARPSSKTKQNIPDYIAPESCNMIIGDLDEMIYEEEDDAALADLEDDPTLLRFPWEEEDITS